LATTQLSADLIGFVEGNPDAKLLYDELLTDYNRLIRPVTNTTDKLTVKLGLKLSQLIDVVSGKAAKGIIQYIAAC
jgi:nicotinic acetylcholine receptor